MYLKISILSLFTILSMAQTYKFDSNYDSKIDHIMEVKNNSIISEKIDRNFDGNFEIRIKYNQNDMAMYFEQDTNNDGEIDLVIEEVVQKSGVVISEYKFVNRKRVLITSYIRSVISKEEECDSFNRGTVLDDIGDFIQQLSPTFQTQKDGFHYFVNNFRIHKSCVKKWKKKNTTKIINNVLGKGLSCLKDLAKSQVNIVPMPDIFMLLNKFELHQSGVLRPTTVLCDEDQARWDGVLGMASTAAKYKDGTELTPMGKPGIKHPFISINPKIEKKFFSGFTEDLDQNKLSGIIFHEMFHNYGYDHGQGIDLAYACETCCFDKSADANQAACKICSGSYKSYKDSKYVLDLAIYGANTDLLVAKYLFYGKIEGIEKDNNYKVAMLVSTLGSSPDLTKALRDQLGSLDTSIIKDEFVLKRLNANAKKTRDHLKLVTANSKILARAIIEISLNGDVDKSIEILSQIDLEELNYEAFKPRSTIGASGGKAYKKLFYELNNFIRITNSAYPDSDMYKLRWKMQDFFL